MTLMVPCPNCPDGFNGPTRTNTSVCKTCGGTHQVPARTGETPEASYLPDDLAILAYETFYDNPRRSWEKLDERDRQRWRRVARALSR